MTSDELVEFAETLCSRDDFFKFVEYYVNDYHENKSEWENTDLESYLAGMGEFIKSIDGYYRNRGESISDVPSWRVLADILLAACVVEG